MRRIDGLITQGLKAIYLNFNQITICVPLKKLFKLQCLSEYAYFCLSVQLDTKDGAILLDYSKNIITEDTMSLLMSLVRYSRACSKCGHPCKADTFLGVAMYGTL